MTTQAIVQMSTGSEFAPHTTLRGTWLWLARTAWVLVCAASLLFAGGLMPVILRSSDYGDWTIEASAPLFGINIFSNAFTAYGLFFLSLKSVAVVIFIGIALYIFWRKSDDWLAILVSLMLLSFPHTFNLSGYAESWYMYPALWARLFSLLDDFFNGIGFVFIFSVFFLFPDGHFVPRWTRWAALYPLVAVLVLWGNDALPSPLIRDENLTWLILITSFLVILLLGAASQVYRYRYVSSPVQQAQTRIVVASLVVLAATFSTVFVVSFVGFDTADSPLGTFVNLLFSIFIPSLLPLAFAAAILRDQLWQSERVVNRAFVYGALSAILLFVYVLIVGALSQVFRAADNFLIAAVATGIVALLFQPLRERLQRSINRFLYGERQDPLGVLNRLGTRMENTLAPDVALPLIVETIARAMRVPYAAIELMDEAQGRRTEFGSLSLAINPIVFPLKYENVIIGKLVVARRTPHENFSAGDLQLLETIARQAGTVVYTAHLNKQLRESRERIIVEREQERRRLRRDLHDGLGPTLASQTLKLDAALELLHGDDAANASARRILQDVKTQTQSTVADIRRIVYELRPPALDDLGLAGALRAHLAQHNEWNHLHITLEAPAELPPLSAAVQVNAYRIVLEAVNNVVRHANANQCMVKISTNGTLRMEIWDDGQGLPAEWQPGVGITSMRERAEELGGTFLIQPNEPKGTRVVAELPLGRQG